MIYEFLADGFEEMEALAPVDILRRAGLSVTTVGVGGRLVTGAHGIPVTADVSDADAVFSDMEAVILPGGMPGTRNLDRSPAVDKALEQAVAENAVIAAICAAPSVLGHRGLLCGRRATCFPGFEAELTGAFVAGDAVVTDGRFVTARGAGVAVEFALTLVSVLVSPEKAKELKETMQCR